MKKLLHWISGKLPCRIINDGNTPYLERYYIGTLFGWRFYLHQFIGSDPDRGLHDHPWSRAFSIILSGYYYEQARAGIRKVRWFNSLTGDSFHRVVLPDVGGLNVQRQPCWTLFAHTAEDVKTWGFLRPIEEVNRWQYTEKAGRSGVLHFVPYAYKIEGGKPKQWWETAKTGKQIRAARGEV